ncbi:MAG: periplasmic heavy metal sensor [Labilithrix sp.]|nr:periplasmic heavy metal sensor [Labilithrix sp.]MCW5814948.1 periplasmic heavy metal sensor [Labilithrix sp.]
MALCGIGIAAGVIGVVALVRRFLFRRHYARFGGGGYACGPRGGARWRRGPGGSFWLRAVFARLDTTPGQEREIRSAIEDFQTQARAAKEGLKGAREHLAKAVGAEAFDESALVEASATAEDATGKVKEALAATLRRIHAVLDAHQRERLAELLARGPRFRARWGGPYRDAAV